jgi:hypothetical protein
MSEENKLTMDKYQAIKWFLQRHSITNFLKLDVPEIEDDMVTRRSIAMACMERLVTRGPTNRNSLEMETNGVTGVTVTKMWEQSVYKDNDEDFCEHIFNVVDKINRHVFFHFWNAFQAIMYLYRDELDLVPNLFVHDMYEFHNGETVAFMKELEGRIEKLAPVEWEQERDENAKRAVVTIDGKYPYKVEEMSTRAHNQQIALLEALDDWWHECSRYDIDRLDEYLYYVVGNLVKFWNDREDDEANYKSSETITDCELLTHAYLYLGEQRNVEILERTHDEARGYINPLEHGYMMKFAVDSEYRDEHGTIETVKREITVFSAKSELECVLRAVDKFYGVPQK